MIGEQDLLEATRREAERVGGERATARHAIVDGYDATAYAVRVRYQPENTLSGWLPLLTIRAGNGAGIYAPPNVGDQVLVSFQEGDHEAGVVLGALYSEADKPLAVPAGEVWFVHEAGAVVKMLPGGKIAIVAPGGVTMDTPLLAVTGDVKAGTVSLQQHRHTGVRGGGETSGPPAP